MGGFRSGAKLMKVSVTGGAPQMDGERVNAGWHVREDVLPDRVRRRLAHLVRATVREGDGSSWNDTGCVAHRTPERRPDRSGPRPGRWLPQRSEGGEKIGRILSSRSPFLPRVGFVTYAAIFSMSTLRRDRAIMWSPVTHIGVKGWWISSRHSLPDEAFHEHNVASGGVALLVGESTAHRPKRWVQTHHLLVRV